MTSPNRDELHRKISANLRQIKATITDAAQRAGRSPEEVTIVAVTKNVGTDAIMAAIECGIKVVGENRIQEASAKFDSL